MYRFCLAVVLSLQALPLMAQAQVTGWHTDLDSAVKVARATDKPLFVVFRCVR